MMIRPFALCAIAISLSACQTTLFVEEEPVPEVPPPPPPYPPGYEPAGQLPELVEENVPAGIVPEQVIIADDGCYFYYVGALTTPITLADGKSKLCVQREPVGTPVDISGIPLGSPTR
jgi:hypothetical protein